TPAFAVLSLAEIPLAGVQVALLDLAGELVTRGKTDSNGRYSLAASPGTYAVEAAYQISTGATVAEVNLSNGSNPVQVDTASTLAVTALIATVASASTAATASSPTATSSPPLLGFTPNDVSSVATALSAAGITDAAAQTLAQTSIARIAAADQLVQDPTVHSAIQTATTDRASNLQTTEAPASSSGSLLGNVSPVN
ncbi:MAG: carboxypeptidase regulatory-like domain-containing protein, partial [Cyanobacteria bacterium REEB65]|nr:carboxypeptidase regulatory-like domain-containing protein [Cyanobacteria bacterium REEB65]